MQWKWIAGVGVIWHSTLHAREFWAIYVITPILKNKSAKIKDLSAKMLIFPFPTSSILTQQNLFYYCRDFFCDLHKLEKVLHSELKIIVKIQLSVISSHMVDLWRLGHKFNCIIWQCTIMAIEISLYICTLIKIIHVCHFMSMYGIAFCSGFDMFVPLMSHLTCGYVTCTIIRLLLVVMHRYRY